MFLPSPVVSAAWLAEHLDRVQVVDVRWSMTDGPKREAFEAGHIPTAVFADLDVDLSSPAGEQGRHPLPSPEDFAAARARLGLVDRPVVAYDDQSGAVAARLWWMLDAIGHPAAVLDGGIQAWTGELDVATEPASDATPESDEPTNGETAPDAGAAADAEVEDDPDNDNDNDNVVADAEVEGDPDDVEVDTEAEQVADTDDDVVPLPEVVAWPTDRFIGADDVLDAVEAGGVLLDARSHDRFIGTPNDIDPRPGHVPGARSRPWTDNVGPDGRLLPVELLRAGLSSLGVEPGSEILASCGSGVTGCHDLLVARLIGLEGGRLYAGSWSEWALDPDRPVATGNGERT
ncbi:MAG: sulfurtransferase [Actinomycetota bacterium]